MIKQSRPLTLKNKIIAAARKISSITGNCIAPLISLSKKSVFLDHFFSCSALCVLVLSLASADVVNSPQCSSIYARSYSLVQPSTYYSTLEVNRYMKTFARTGIHSVLTDPFIGLSQVFVGSLERHSFPMTNLSRQE